MDFLSDHFDENGKTRASAKSELVYVQVPGCLPRARAPNTITLPGQICLSVQQLHTAKAFGFTSVKKKNYHAYVHVRRLIHLILLTIQY